jgi:hypothetical protein
MYAFTLGAYSPLYVATKAGAQLSLVDCLRAVYGVANARVYRGDGTLAVDQAGSSVEVVHAPTGRHVYRRRVS